MATKGGKQYGKDSTPNPAVSKFAGLAEDAPRGAVEWSEVDGRAIKAAVCGATESGAALILAKTQDGGALAVTLLDGPRRVKKYFNSAGEAESWLMNLASLAND